MWFTAAAFLDATTVEREQTSQVVHTDHELELNSSARVCKCAGVHIATGGNLQGLQASGRSFVLGPRTRTWSDGPTPRPSEFTVRLAVAVRLVGQVLVVTVSSR